MYDIEAAVKKLCSVLPQETLVPAHAIVIEQALNAAYVQGKVDGGVIMADFLKKLGYE